jgi:5-methylcytosine-specific restriction endonuclease McrA
MDCFITDISEQQIKKEKDRARELRKTRWWADRVARGACHYCGGNFAPGELTMDHLVPLVRGGKSSRNNIVPACKECNNRKKYLLPIEWEEFLNRQNGCGE